MRKLKQVKKELVKLESRKALLEALDKYDEILLGAGVNKVVIDGAREDFYRWEDRYVERY